MHSPRILHRSWRRAGGRCNRRNYQLGRCNTRLAVAERSVTFPAQKGHTVEAAEAAEAAATAAAAAVSGAAAALEFLRKIVGAEPLASLEDVDQACSRLRESWDEALVATKEEWNNRRTLAYKKVCFDLTHVDVYEVEAQSQFYGVRPREFVFDKYLNILPAGDANGFADMQTVLRRRQRGPRVTRRRGQSILSSPIDISDDECMDVSSDDDVDPEVPCAAKPKLSLFALLTPAEEESGC